MTDKTKKADDKKAKPSKKATEAQALNQLAAAGFSAAQIEALTALFKRG